MLDSRADGCGLATCGLRRLNKPLGALVESALPASSAGEGFSLGFKKPGAMVTSELDAGDFVGAVDDLVDCRDTCHGCTVASFVGASSGLGAVAG